MHLDVYQVPSSKPTPVVIQLHGGGWIRGDRPSSSRSFSAFFAAGIIITRREGTDAREQVGDVLGSRRYRFRRGVTAPLRLRCRLQKRGGGSATVAVPMRKVGARACAINSPWRVRRASSVFSGDLRQRPVASRRQRTRNHAHRRRGRRPSRSPGYRAASWSVLAVRRWPRPLERAIEAFGQDRAAIDGDEVMRARGGKADLEHVMGAAARVKDDAAAAFAMGVDEIGDRRVDRRPAATRSPRDRASRRGRRARPVLQGAAAANAEMRADRRDAVRARCLDGDQRAPVGMAGHGFDLDGLARQRAGDINRPLRRHRRRRRRDGQCRSMTRRSTTFGLDEEFAIAVAAEKAGGSMPPTRQPSDAICAPMSSQTICERPRRARCLS